MKKIIDYEKYLKKEQTMKTIRYHDPKVTTLEIRNVFYKCVNIKDQEGKTTFTVKPITLIFRKTGVSGINLPNPTLSSLRVAGIDKGKLKKIYPFGAILFKEDLDFEGNPEYRDASGLPRVVKNNLNKKLVNGMRLNLRSNHQQYGHVNEFQLVEILESKEVIEKEMTKLPRNDENKILGIQGLKMEHYFENPVQLEMDLHQALTF